MIAATRPVQRPKSARLLVVDREGRLESGDRSRFVEHLAPGDLVVANDAATLPASLQGVHRRTGEEIEIRLAGRPTLHGDDTCNFTAVVFGRGDHHTPTEQRPPPPPLRPGDRLPLGPLDAIVVRLLGHPRLVRICLGAPPDVAWAGIAQHGRPIQYAYLEEELELWDVQTRIAGPAVAFEPPSAGFVLDWKILQDLRDRGVGFATLTHAAGISSTGDDVLDHRLPLDEPYRIPAATVEAIEATRRRQGRVVALGTTVVRALEHAGASGVLRAGEGLADQRLGPESVLRVVDAVVSGVHAKGESHYELLRAFTDDSTLEVMEETLRAEGYRSHEFGDSVLLERSPLEGRSLASCFLPPAAVGREAHAPT